MKVLEKGKPKKEWSIEVRCAGAVDELLSDICGALLLVEQDDLYTTKDIVANNAAMVTCPECKSEMFIFDIPHHIFKSVPLREEWMSHHTIPLPTK